MGQYIRIAANINVKAAWNMYARALSMGMPFAIDEFLSMLHVCRIINWQPSVVSGVLTWLAKNVPIPSDHHACMMEIVVYEFVVHKTMLSELVDTIDAYVKIGMTMSSDEIYHMAWRIPLNGDEIDRGFDAKSIFVGRLYRLRVIDPVEQDVGMYLYHLGGTQVAEDLIRIVMFERQVRLPQLLRYEHGPHFFEKVLPVLYHEGLVPVGAYDFRHYTKEPTMRMKLAMITNNVDHEIDDLRFDDRKLKLKFKRMQNRAIAMCDHLPVELVYQAAAKTGVRALCSKSMLRRMKERQDDAMNVVIIE
jgi:hypothetical protein